MIQSLLELFGDTTIATPQLVAFFLRLLQTLPSSSDPTPSSKPLPEVVIGELIIDVYWSVEMQVEEHLYAAKASLTAETETSEKQVDSATRSPSDEKKPSVDPTVKGAFMERKRRAETGKEVLCEFLRQLLVSLWFIHQKH